MTTAVAQRRILGYARVSTVRQAGERNVNLETQQARILSHAQRLNGVHIATFVDVATGRRDDRQEYRRMVDLALQGGADVIVVQFLDRFGRNPREILRRIWELQDRGITVEATDEDIREEMILLIRAGMAGAESRRTSERVRANMARAVSKGRHAGRTPHGLRPVHRLQDGRAVVDHWELHPEEAQVVREMYRLSVEENLGFKAIADRLNATGQRVRPGYWVASSVQHILQSPHINGVMEYGRRPRSKVASDTMEKVTIRGAFPKILSDEEWAVLQERLQVRRVSPRGHAHKSEYLLSSLLRCGHCGGVMVGKVGYAYKGRKYRNYVCSNHTRSRAACEYANGHSAPKLEAAILEYLGQFSDPARVEALVAASRPSDLEALQARLEAVTRRLADLDRDFHQNLDLLKRGVLDETDFMRANAARREERAHLEAARTDLEARVQTARARMTDLAAVPVKVRSFLEDFGSLDVRRAKARLQLILKAIHVWRDGRVDLEFR